MRYWAPSAWVRFMHGPGALLQAGPAWADQYAAQIDAYALGILGVEVHCSKHKLAICKNIHLTRLLKTRCTFFTERERSIKLLCPSPLPAPRVCRLGTAQSQSCRSSC